MTTFTILSTGGSANATSEFEVHATSCRDIARKTHSDPFVLAFDMGEWPSAEALVAAEVEVYTDQDQGWTADDHRIMGCAR